MVIEWPVDRSMTARDHSFSKTNGHWPVQKYRSMKERTGSEPKWMDRSKERNGPGLKRMDRSNKRTGHGQKSKTAHSYSTVALLKSFIEIKGLKQLART